MHTACSVFPLGAPPPDRDAARSMDLPRDPPPDGPPSPEEIDPTPGENVIPQNVTGDPLTGNTKNHAGNLRREEDVVT